MLALDLRWVFCKETNDHRDLRFGSQADNVDLSSSAGVGYRRSLVKHLGVSSVISFFILMILLFGSGCTTQSKSEAKEPLTTSEVLARWHSAFDNVRSLRGSQSFEYIGSLPTQTPQVETGLSIQDKRRELQTTEETYDLKGGNARFRFVAHYARVDEITLWDGKEAFRYRPWLNEVYRPLPESYASGAYWTDDVDVLSLLTLIRPLDEPERQFSVSYDLIGVSNLDGRQVIELIVKPGVTEYPTGLEGTRIFLDASSYLPYRIIIPPSPSASRGRSVVRTVKRIEINPDLTDEDFTLPSAPETTVI